MPQAVLHGPWWERPSPSRGVPGKPSTALQCGSPGATQPAGTKGGSQRTVSSLCHRALPANGAADGREPGCVPRGEQIALETVILSPLV